jgi:serine/threonine protein kinase/Tfp pilus assembly protein PilF
MNERSIFMEALELGDPQERAEFLRRACNGDERLRERVEALLRSHRAENSFVLDRVPAVDLSATADLPPAAEPVGTVIGPYKLREQIGEGGMGVVYVAEQTQPVRRKVALKIIKPGMDTKQVIARFEAERQALAMMDHPNIARVHDGGATESGRPYFVMELVRGIPITEYCDRERLSIADRLELFVLVCRSVQHAHQKGIIHRDLKPSNILVTVIDGVAVPKVIDFGVAKATGASLTERTLYTAFQQFIGTPLYVSPEQADLAGMDVDTRSDIYSLGVLLYELLTGTTPFDQDTFRPAALDEMRRIIREQEPPKPSTRLSSLGATRATVSDNRQADARQLDRAVRGELDWIVMKALEKDRRRRYETANDFAADVMRYLTGHPVAAGPPSAGYRLRKFVRRNKGPVAAGLALAALLVLGTVGTSIGLVWALRAETKAKEEAAVAKAVNDFLLEDLLAEAAPEKNARAKKVTVEELLGRAAARIVGKFAQQPTVEAEIRLTIGKTYVALGDFTAAQPHLERALKIGRGALGEEHHRTLHFMNDLGTLYMDQGKSAQAEPLLTKALEARRRALGEEHPETLVSMNNLATLHSSRAEPLLLRILEVRRRALGEEHPDTLVSMNNLAVLYRQQHRNAEAEPLLFRTLEIRRRVRGEEHPDTLISTHNLASLYLEQGRLAQAEPLLIKALEGRRHALTEEHLDTLTSMAQLAGLYLQQGQFAQAEPLLVKALEGRRRARGEEHPDTLSSMNDLASLYLKKGQFARAEPLLVKTLEISRRERGEEHPDTLRSMNDLAFLYQRQGRLALAEPLLVKVLEICRRTQGERHPNTLVCMQNLAAIYWSTGQLERSVPLFEEALKRRQTELGPDHPSTLNTMANLGVNYRDAGRLPEGTALLEQAWAMARKRPGPLAAVLDWIPSALAETYDQAGRFADSEPLHRESLEAARKRHGEASLQVADALDSLGRHLLKRRKYADADSLLRECLVIREQKWPDDWWTSNTRSRLGGSLLGQKKYDEAEPLLLAGYEGMKQREEKIAPVYKIRLTEAIDRLVQLYEAWGKPGKAAVWKARLGLTDLPADVFARP